MNWSHFQQKIFNELANTNDNIMVSAKAGSGKTATIIEGGKHVATPVHIGTQNELFMFAGDLTNLYLAFGHDIVDELKLRVPSGSEASTQHSLGMSMCRTQLGSKSVNKGKVWDIMTELGIPHPDKLLWDARTAALALRFSISQITSMAKACMCKTEADILGVCDMYDLYVHDDTVIPTVVQVLDKCYRDVKSVDFEDMYWLPLRYNCLFPQHNVVFVDELQDMNRAQLEFISRFKCRVIGVGDENQSLYAFRGADPSAMPKFKSMFNATELPLNYTYRCAKSIVRLAQEYVPDIEALPDAPEGYVGFLEGSDLYGHISSSGINVGDMILCRYNAPLVDMAMSFIANNMKVTVRGRDIGINIATFARKFFKRGKPMERCHGMMVEHVQKELAKPCSMERRRNLIDKLNIVKIFESHVSYPEQVAPAIENLFSDNRGHIDLSSIHKAKGLEADSVFVLEVDDPRNGPRNPMQMQQERNAKYVAITRAKTRLTFVNCRDEGMEECYAPPQ